MKNNKRHSEEFISWAQEQSVLRHKRMLYSMSKIAMSDKAREIFLRAYKEMALHYLELSGEGHEEERSGE